ncbi:MAG: DUF2461 family protein [Acidimicrobiales bacterium]
MELSDYGPFRLFRPYNDVRFAKGKPLYKTAQGAYTEGEGGAGYYVHFSAEGFMAGAGSRHGQGSAGSVPRSSRRRRPGCRDRRHRRAVGQAL